VNRVNTITSDTALRPTIGLAGRFLRALVASLGLRLIPALGVSLALALAEGAGLVLLVPLLGTVGLSVDDGASSRLSAWTSRLFAAARVEPSLPAVLFVFLVVSGLHALLNRSHLLLGPTLEQRFVDRLRTRLYRAIVSARWTFVVRQRATDLTHALTTESDRVSTAAYQLLTLFSGIALTAVYFAVAARLSSTLTVVVAVVGLLLLWSLRSRVRRSAERADAYATAGRDLFRMASESIAGLKVARGFGAERREIDRFASLSGAVQRAYLGMLRAFADAKLRMDLAAAATVCGLLYVAVAVFELRGAGLLLLIFVFARIVPRLVALQDAAQLFVAGLPAFAAVTSLTERCEREAEPAGAADARRLGLSAHVRLDHVSFQYDTSDVPAVRDVSLLVPTGKTTAIVGASGAGKSTIVDLVMGLLAPTRGVLTVDDRELTPMLGQCWRQCVGYVPQDTFLLHDTIRANLRWARPDACDAEIWRALELSAAREMVEAFPAGLDTVVGDRGVRLSGGERQRIALARALLVEPDVLVLDEATSALDSVNERLILSSIARLHGSLTILIITHRLATVRDADVIYVLDRGRVVEEGSWQVLASHPAGTFRRLLDAQHPAIAHPQREAGQAAIHGHRPSESS
jgi:ATP-binding cassette subfamily C protein